MTTSIQTTATAAPKQLTIREQLSGDYFKAQVATALPKHMTADRFVRVALTALMRTPKLMQCTQASVMECMLNCSALGLEPDGRRAHLIPYGDKCTLIIDYKGIVELAKRSGDVANVFAQIVCENDTFTWKNGEITHLIDWKSPRGKAYAVYAQITFKDGTVQCDVMTLDEVNKIRGRSKSKDEGPWVTDYDEMAKKTVFRRASKWVVLSPEVQDALDKEQEFSSLRNITPTAPNFAPPPPLLGSSESESDGDLGPETKPATVKKVEPAPVLKPTVREEIELAQVPFDDFRDFLVTHNISSRDSVDALGSYDDVPVGTFEFLTAKLKRSLISTFGVKPA